MDREVAPGCQAQQSCQEQQRLINTVLDHLLRISQLSRATAAAVTNGSENSARELDWQVELELGRKEQAFGALRQHRLDHGC